MFGAFDKLKDFLKRNKKPIIEAAVVIDNKSPQNDDSLNDNYIFNFRNWSSGNANFSIVNTDNLVITGGAASGGVTVKQETIKLPIKPIDVVNELELPPMTFNLENLDEKIAILKYKAELIKQKYAKREVVAMIERLENRRKYAEFQKFFEQFKDTNEQKIDDLLNKYKLVMCEADLFIPEFPNDAIAIMKAYSEAMHKLCGKKPVFYVIAEENKFRKAYEKRDPILLVQSPFGFYYQILGAWIWPIQLYYHFVKK